MNAVKQFESNCGSCGFVEALRRAANDLNLIASYRSLDIYLKDLTPLPGRDNEIVFPVVLSQEPHWEAREIFAEQIPRVSFAQEFPSVKSLPKKFDLGSRLFVVFDADETGVAFIWVNEKTADMPHIKRPAITLPDRTFYVHSVVVASAFRNRGMGTLLQQAVLGLMAGQGYQRALLAAYVKNSRGQRWHLANGYEKWGRVFYFEWRGKARRCNQLTQVGRRNSDLLNR